MILKVEYLRRICRKYSPYAPKICFPYIGDTIGGSHFSSLTLYTALAENDFHPHIVLHKEGRLDELLKERHLDYELLPLEGYSSTEPSWSKRALKLASNTRVIRRYLAKTQPDIVYTNDSRSHLEWTLASKLQNIPHIHHVRAKWSSYRYNNLLSQLTPYFVCVSDYVHGSCPNYVRRVAKTVHNPFKLQVNEDGLRPPELLQTIGCLTPDTTIIGFVGNLLEQKRPEKFIEAAAKTAAKYDGPLAFVMLGDDRNGWWAELEKRADVLGLQSKLYYFGFQNPIESWISSFDILLAPSVNEGWGRTLIEAMLLGVPVVAPRSGGNMEIFKDGETGLLCNPDDTEDMAEKVVSLLAYRAKAEAISRNAQIWAAETCSVEQHVQKMQKIFCTALPRV